MRILREFAVNRLRRRILRAFFELELILFFLRRVFTNLQGTILCMHGNNICIRDSATLENRSKS